MPGPVVAVDCNGADLGPGEVAAGAALAAAAGRAGAAVRPRPRARHAAARGRDRRRAGVDRQGARPGTARCARRRRPRSCAPPGRWPPGRRRRSCAPAAPARRWPPAILNVKRAHGDLPPGARAAAAGAVAPGDPARRRRQRRRAPRAPRPVRLHGRGAGARPCSGSRGRASALLSNGDEADARQRARARDARRAGRARRRGGSFDFVGNVEGVDLVSGAADVIVTDGFTGNIALKVMEGVSQATIGGDPRPPRPRRRGPQAGGLLLRPALRGFRDEIDPERQGGAYLLGLRRLGIVAHGRFTRQGFAQAILRARLGAERGPRRAHPRGPRAGRRAAGQPGVRGERYRGRPMTREEVFSLIQSHLADELDVEPGADRRADALQGGSRGRLARPVHARPGARGLLRRAHVRRAGGIDPHRRPGGRLRPRAGGGLVRAAIPTHGVHRESRHDDVRETRR